MLLHELMSYIFPTLLGPNVQIFLVLAEWWLPNLPLAIAYELACWAHSNYKLEYFTVYRSDYWLKLYYWNDTSWWMNFLLGEPFITVHVQ